MVPGMHRLIVLLGLLLSARAGLGAEFRPLESSTNQAIFFSYAFSDDGRWIAGGTSSRRPGGATNVPVVAGQIVLWDAKTLRQTAILGDHGATVNWMQFSRGGKVLATASGGTATIKVWDPEKRTLLHTLKLEEPVLASSSMGSQMLCALSPDGTRLAAVGAVIKPIGISKTSEAATLTVWDLGNGKPLWSVTNSGIGAMAFTPDSSVLVGYSRNIVWELVREIWSSRIEKETLMAWDVADGKRRFANPIPKMNPSHLVVPASGDKVLALGGDKNIWYSLKDGLVASNQTMVLRQSLHVAALSPKSDKLFAIDFSAERFHMVYLTNGASIVVSELKGYTNRLMFASPSHDLSRIAGTRGVLPTVMELAPAESTKP